MKDEFFKVPKLQANGSNWVTYRDRLRWVLDARGLLSHIDQVTLALTPPVAPNTSPSPNDNVEDETTAGTTTTTTTSPTIEEWAYQGRLEHHHTNEATVKQCIAGSIPDSLFNCIKGKTTAKEVWDALVLIFEDRSTMVAIDYRLKLQAVKCTDNEDV